MRTARTRETTESESIAITKKAALADLKFFARQIYWHGNEQYQNSWGRCHDFMVDFLRLGELGNCICHSGLDKYLPPKENGLFKERWLYYKTLDEEPVIQDGPEGKVSEMYKGSEIWKGILIRIIGDGKSYLSLLYPRYHLKSQIATQIRTLWDIIRKPEKTHVVRTQSENLSESFLGGVKSPFDDSNSLFSKLWGNLKPKGREVTWSKSAIRVVSDVFDVNPTLATAGINSDVTGTHPQVVTLDDISVEQNTDTDEKCQALLQRISNMLMTLPKNGQIFDIGTKWNNQDGHYMFTHPEGSLYPYTSFLVATVKMADDSFLWREWWNEEMYKVRAEGGKNNMFQVYCNFYNQPIAGRLEKFDPNWLKFYEECPEQLAQEKKLKIAIFCDPAESTETRADMSAMVVKGQTPDGANHYVLEVKQGQWAADEMPTQFADLIAKWWKISQRAKLAIIVGAEKERYFAYIHNAVLTQLNRLGIPLDIEPQHHGSQSKKNRIAKMLMWSYKVGAVAWPIGLSPLIRNDIDRFNRGLHVDILDAEAYCTKLLDPERFTPIPVEIIHKVPDGPGVYRREKVSDDAISGSGNRAQGRFVMPKDAADCYRRLPERPMPRRYQTIFARENERRMAGFLRAVPKEQVCTQ